MATSTSGEWRMAIESPKSVAPAQREDVVRMVSQAAQVTPGAEVIPVRSCARLRIGLPVSR